MPGVIDARSGRHALQHDGKGRWSPLEHLMKERMVVTDWGVGDGEASCGGSNRGGGDRARRWVARRLAHRMSRCDAGSLVVGASQTTHVLLAQMAITNTGVRLVTQVAVGRSGRSCGGGCLNGMAIRISKAGCNRSCHGRWLAVRCRVSHSFEGLVRSSVNGATWGGGAGVGGALN